MKNFKYIIVLFTLIGFTSCSNDNETYATNGETIFRTGVNIHGAVLQDISQSEIKKVHGCANCHGDNGKGKFRGGGDKQTGSITYYDLTNTSIYTPVYNDDLIKRFIDSETKSDDTHANTGVVYVMKETDKIDLINFLKTL
ncbi:c-type cytochrome [Flavobacterium caseinilyticum]|uniref:C-type cytochrome n=1 Tax=Flavobacterium caseinilyticum TaxID=2541732 RepID=A0A4R5AW40_9FLAO|nr:c-type cytochrome [Flavobacterium caseinilyticum]TDD77281.1 c-type cytochrome [Flavobacterium caseinilyticum]